MIRSPLPMQNGMQKPGHGTIGHRIWEVIDTTARSLGRAPTISELLALPDFAADIPVNVRSIYSRWRKFNNIVGHLQAAPAVLSWVKPIDRTPARATGTEEQTGAGRHVPRSRHRRWRSTFDIQDVERLAEIITLRFRHVAIRDKYGWPDSTALTVLDCVLSLNRRYDTMVFPRVKGFGERHAEVNTLANLSTMMSRHTQVGAFLSEHLRYNDARREQTLRGVVQYLLSICAGHPGNSERAALEGWALSAEPEDYLQVGVRGFGLAGFQYLRMLLGVQTTKPDVHIIRFVSDALAKTVSAVAALTLLEQAAAQAKLPLREVDGAIWRAGAR